MTEGQPPVIRSIGLARAVAKHIFDWAHWNLSEVESSDTEEPGWSFKAYKAAEALVEALAKRPADAPSAPPLCSGCGVYPADPPGDLCPGCDAYREHQQ